MQNSKDCPDGSIEKPRPNAEQPAEEHVPRSAKSEHRPSAKVHGRAHVPTREASSRGRPNQNHTPEAAHDRTARTGKATPRGRAAQLMYRGRSDQEGLVPRPAENLGQSIHPSDPTNERENSRPRSTDRADSHTIDSRPNVPTDRPNGPVDPKPFLKPVSQFQAQSRRRLS
ncbi:unnamed protein product [Microthlaspi erraticum]|uniref:Uncharacterized protein n=1 Tax=Microthlaspi erraticum TaxID=1685480 RepID=A0A6D2JMZ8_9BRAS|nr:unnamed protein product [Microthlaspi erraticum]